MNTSTVVLLFLLFVVITIGMVFYTHLERADQETLNTGLEIGI